MKVTVFGGTGFIGVPLVKELKNRGHEVLVLDQRRDPQWKQQMAGSQAIINLAGFPLFKKRWTIDVKSEIYDSRVEGTRAIVSAIGELKNTQQEPKVFISGSAIGFYGPDFDVEFTEESHAGADFLAFVCRDWEAEAEKAATHYGVRTVLLRTGIVLGKDGGALAQILPPFKAFIGGPIGSGKQWMSWIHLDDMVGLILHALENSSIKGPLNATSPQPERNKDFSKKLGSTLNRPSLLPVPSLGLYALVGEAAEILVNGQKVLPKKALDTQYKFKYPSLESALGNILK